MHGTSAAAIATAALIAFAVCASATVDATELDNLRGERELVVPVSWCVLGSQARRRAMCARLCYCMFCAHCDQLSCSCAVHLACPAAKTPASTRYTSAAVPRIESWWVSDICVGALLWAQIKDGTESDIDCGGSCTTKCPKLKKCKIAGDCASGVCLTTKARRRSHCCWTLLAVSARLRSALLCSCF
jgi:hypothetical protein